MRRYVRIALGLLALGVAPAVIRARLEADGVSAEDAQTAVRRARLAVEREQEPGQPDIFKHRRVLTCNSADLATCGSVVATVLCDDLADAGPDLSTCTTNESQTFAVGNKVCNSSDVEVGRSSELALRDRDLDGLNAAETTEQAAGRSFRVRTLAGWQTFQANNNLKKCPEVTP
jgi:hypothetical protein